MGKNKKKNKNRQNQSTPPSRHPHFDEENKDLSAAVDPISLATAPAAAVSPVMECEVCSEEYDQRRVKPRNLQCGHTFCSRCCMNLVESCAIICPRCRIRTPVEDVNDLPVNYPLLDILSSVNRDAALTTSMKKEQGLFTDYKKKVQTSPHGGRCLEAQAEVTVHCAHCDLWLCKDCSHIDHKHPECVLVPYQDTLKEMSQAGKVKIKTSQHSLDHLYCEANAYGNKLSSCAAIMEIALDCLKKEQSHLPSVLIHCRKLEEEMGDIAVKHVPTNVKDALSYLKKLEMVTEETQLWAVKASTTILKMEQVSKLSKVLLQTAVQMHTTTDGSMMGLHSINDVDVILPVDVVGNRLLVHAAQHAAPTMGCRMVKLNHIKSCIDPSCALTFLDIGLKGQEMGRVFIRLLDSTKQSRCFLMMCTGEAGPSFRNTRFHRVWWKGLPGEHLWMGDYDCESGRGGSLPRAMQEDTKELSNKKTEVPINAGLVAARYGNKSTIFRVYTRESTDAKEEFALGQVESGLQVLKDAFKHIKNITDLIISDCGVVVEP